MIESITNHFAKYDLDFRKGKGIKFYNQKITPDVLCVIADCILNLVADRKDFEFYGGDIYTSKYFNYNVKSIFKKPDAQNKKAKREYDKFIGQPLVLLGYAKILSVRKYKGKNHYKIIQKNIIKFISYRERNAYLFLDLYLTEVLDNSGQIKNFQNFKDNNNKETFELLRNQFIKFFIGNSNLGTRGAKNPASETKKIFNKILNIYCHSNSIKGQSMGRFSNKEIGFYDLMYNKPNWRDIGKEKKLTRQEAKKLISMKPTDEKAIAYSDYQVQKAMKMIRNMYSESEVKDQWANGDATQIHHIFPKADFPLLAHYLENLIKLTPTQHYTKAHPNNKTQQIDRDYQLVCLLAKTDSVESSLRKGEFVYRKESLVYVINKGLTETLEYDIDFRTIKRELTRIYNIV